MEKKTQELKNQSRSQKEYYSQESSKDHHRKVWDCGSTLYDSFELDSLKRQLDSAIVSRTLSMPHISDRRFDVFPAPPIRKKSSKISRSLNRLIKSVFSKSNKQDRSLQDRYCYKSGAPLTTIQEVTKIDYGTFSPEMIEYSCLVRKTASDRFKAVPIIGITCA